MGLRGVPVGRSVKFCAAKPLDRSLREGHSMWHKNQSLFRLAFEGRRLLVMVDGAPFTPFYNFREFRYGCGGVSGKQLSSTVSNRIPIIFFAIYWLYLPRPAHGEVDVDVATWPVSQIWQRRRGASRKDWRISTCWQLPSMLLRWHVASTGFFSTNWGRV